MKRRGTLMALGIVLVMFAGLALSGCIESTDTAQGRMARYAQSEEYLKRLMESFGSVDGSEPDTYPDWYGGAYVDRTDQTLVVSIFAKEDYEEISIQVGRTIKTRDYKGIEARYPYNRLKRVMGVIEKFKAENPAVKNSPGHYLVDRYNKVVVTLSVMNKEQRDLFKKEVCDSSCIVFVQADGFTSEEEPYDGTDVGFEDDKPETVNDGIVEARAELDGDELLFTITNVGEKRLRFGIPFILQTYVGGAWEKVNFLNGAFTAIGLGLGAGESYEERANLADCFGKLAAGRYRISKPMDLEDDDGRFTTFVWARAEFDIP